MTDSNERYQAMKYVHTLAYGSKEDIKNISDYEKYRGKCKEFSEALIKKDPTLRLVRGPFDRN